MLQYKQDANEEKRNQIKYRLFLRQFIHLNTFAVVVLTSLFPPNLQCIDNADST